MTNNTLTLASSQPAKLPDPNCGSCNKAGRQQPLEQAVLPPIALNAPETAVETDLFGRPLNRRQRALDEALADRQRNWVVWPLIADGLDLPDSAMFPWHRYSAAFRCGITCSVYCGVSDGMLSLARKSRLSLSKIGISTRPNLAGRMAEANTDRYGSLHEEDGRIVDSAGFDTWEPVRLPPAGEPGHPSPVERLARVLNVSLPNSMTVEAFDAAFTAMLNPCRVDCWIDTPDGERHCARLDIDPRTLRRMTAHVNPDGSVRLKRTKEIYIFRLREDTNRLIAAIESLIAKHLLSTTTDNEATPVTDPSKIRKRP